MIDFKKEKEDAINRFEEERDSYKLTTYESYIKKLNEFNGVREPKSENEFTKMHDEISEKIKELKDKIKYEIKGRSTLEENLKFELAEKKDAKIAELEKELSNFERRLNVVEIKINDDLENKLNKAGAELFQATSKYSYELQSIINNASDDLRERKRKILDEEVNFASKYKPVRYVHTEIENELSRLSQYKN